MAASERTKKLRTLRNVFSLLSFGLWLGVGIFSAITTFLALGDMEFGGAVFSAEFKAMLASIGITTLIGLVLAIILKNKLRTAIWMISLVICSICYKEVGMYVVLGIWALDEYCFTLLANYYNKRLIINKEIDLRG